jgi:hypothetical protein
MKRLSALFIFLSFVVSAQNEPPKFEGPYSFISLPEGDGFKIITNSKVYFTQDGINFTEREHNFQLDVQDFNMLRSDDNIFVHRGGGLVYQYKNDSLVRLDKSYMWRSRFNAAPLIKNDTIALIGGFGEYNEAKNIVYYDDVLREWYEYKIKLKQFEDTILFAQYDSVSDQLIGISEDQANFKYFEYEFKEDIFFDLITEELLGNFYGVFPIHQFPQPLFLSNSDEILKWNLEEKTYSLYRFDKELINERYFVNYNPASKVFLVFDDNRDELLIVNENLLFFQPIKTVSFQLAQKANNKNYLIISLIIILFGLLFLIFIRRRSVAKVVLSQKEEILSELSEAEAIIFTKIVESHPKPIELTELQQDFEPQLTYESRLKKLRKCLTSIENLAREKASVSKSKEVFIHSQSREDKRIKLIRLNQH